MYTVYTVSAASIGKSLKKGFSLIVKTDALDQAKTRGAKEHIQNTSKTQMSKAPPPQKPLKKKPVPKTLVLESVQINGPQDSQAKKGMYTLVRYL